MEYVIGQVLAWRWHGAGMALAWRWHGAGMVLGWRWHGAGMALDLGIFKGSHVAVQRGNTAAI